MGGSLKVTDVLKIEGGYEDLIPEQFVDRENECALVRRRVSVAQRDKIDYPLVEFQGVPGQGKSWLLSYLAHEYMFTGGKGTLARKPPFSAKIDLSMFRTLDSAGAMVQSLISQIGAQVDGQEVGPISTSVGEEPDQLAKALVGLVVQLIARYVPVLVFDSTEQADERLLDWLEESIVYPIVRTDQAVFVFGGRVWHRWKIFEVRRRVEPRELSPLDTRKDQTEETAKMLSKLGVGQSERVARRLYEFAYGHPLASKVIFRALRGPTSESIDESTFMEQQEIVEQVVKAQVVEERLLGGLNGEDDLLPLFWVICVLRKFNATLLRHFAERFLDEGQQQAIDDSYLDVVRRMQDTTLVQWSSTAGGYVLDPVVRKIMAKNLAMRQPDDFRRHHAEAARLYGEWLEQFPLNAASFLLEYTFHRYWVLRTGSDRPDVGDALIADFVKHLEQVKTDPQVEWELPEIAKTLTKELSDDRELEEMIPERTFAELTERVVAFRESVQEPLAMR